MDMSNRNYIKINEKNRNVIKWVGGEFGKFVQITYSF
jgi:hypothetical protein